MALGWPDRSSEDPTPSTETKAKPQNTRGKHKDPCRAHQKQITTKEKGQLIRRYQN